MDIKLFQAERNLRLQEFNKKYEFLKQEYHSAVLAAIQEQNPKNQQELITRILSINTDLSNELRSVISDLYKGSEVVPSATMDQLTDDLIKYQQQYSEIEKGKDRLQTLKLISQTNDKKLSDTNLMFNVYIGLLVFLVFIIGYLVFRTNIRYALSSVSSSVSSITPTQ